MKMRRKQSPKDPWEKWMGKLKYPIHPDELLDKGLAKLIKAMNIPSKMCTCGSCLHDPIIWFEVEDDNWFLSFMLPRILRLNDTKFSFRVEKQYDMWSPITQWYRQVDKSGNQYSWVIKNNGPRSAREFVKDLEAVFLNP